MDEQASDVVIEGMPTRVYASSSSVEEPTVVMVHGGDPRSLANGTDFSTLWRYAGQLAPRLLTYDKPGQGFSFSAADLQRGMQVAQVAQHLRALLDQLAVGPVILLGHSRGALPVLRVLLADPERISGVVVVSSNTVAPEMDVTPRDFYQRAYADPPPQPTREYVGREAAMNSFDRSHLEGTLARTRMAVASQPGWWPSHAARMAGHDQQLAPQFKQARAELLRAFERRRLALPVLTVWGSDDVSAPEALGRALQPHLRRCFDPCDYVTLSGAAHYVYRDRAAAFAAHVRGWVDAVVAAGDPRWQRSGA